MIDSSPEASDGIAVTLGIWIWSGKIHRSGGRQQLCSVNDMESDSPVLKFLYFEMLWFSRKIMLSDSLFTSTSVCVSFIKLHIQRMICLIYALIEGYFFPHQQYIFVLVIGSMCHFWHVSLMLLIIICILRYMQCIQEWHYINHEEGVAKDTLGTKMPLLTDNSTHNIAHTTECHLVPVGQLQGSHGLRQVVWNLLCDYRLFGGVGG